MATSTCWREAVAVHARSKGSPAIAGGGLNMVAEEAQAFVEQRDCPLAVVADVAAAV